MRPERDVWYDEVIPGQPAFCPPVWVPSEHPLFLLYTSGSTGKPKGVLHTTAGFMVHAAATCKYVFNAHAGAGALRFPPRMHAAGAGRDTHGNAPAVAAGDVIWSTGDCGWVTGHTCLAYGPLLLGATALVFEGIPSYPDHGRVWTVVEKYRVKAIYIAPTAIRDMMAHGEAPVRRHDRSSLEVR
jgi:acetyl-CoA synthetase